MGANTRAQNWKKTWNAGKKTDTEQLDDVVLVIRESRIDLNVKSKHKKSVRKYCLQRDARRDISMCKRILVTGALLFSCERIHIPIRNSSNVYIICCYICLCMQTLGIELSFQYRWCANEVAFRSLDTDVWTNNFRYRRRQRRRRRSRMFLCTKFATSGLLSRSIRFRCLIAAHEKPINYSSVYYTLTNVTFTWFHISIHFILEFIRSLLFFPRVASTLY